MATTDLVFADKQFAISQVGLVNLNEQMAIDVSQAGTLVLHVKNYGVVAMLAGVFAFEGSIDSTNGTDGTWFPVQMARTSDGTVENSSGTLNIGIGAGNAYAWEGAVAGLKWFRVRCTTSVTATAIAYWTGFRSSKTSEPAPAIQTHGVYPTTAAQAAQVVSNASLNASVIKAAAATLGELAVYNPTATAFYIKLYNKATAPAPATDGALVMAIIAVPANSGQILNFGTLGKRFPAGLGIAITGAAAAADATNAVAGGIVSLTYI